MKIAITGATGFIGTHLAMKHLEMGDEVRILSRKNAGSLSFPKEVKIYNFDIIGRKEDLDLFVDGVDILYHCAAEIRDESKMFKVNVEGTNNLIQAARGKIKHWVQLSSTGVYGNVMSGEVFETQKLNPINTYEVSKVESDKIVIEAGAEQAFSYSILRPSNVFGADMSNQSLFQLIKAVDKGLFFFIGGKNARANYIPVENVVHALVLVGTSNNAKGKIYNISDSVTMDVFIEYMAKGLNKAKPGIRIPLFLMKILGLIGDLVPKSPLTSGRVDALSNKVIYQNDLIESELGYSPVKTIEEGVKDLVSTYKLKN